MLQNTVVPVVRQRLERKKKLREVGWAALFAVVCAIFILLVDHAVRMLRVTTALHVTNPNREPYAGVEVVRGGVLLGVTDNRGWFQFPRPEHPCHLQLYKGGLILLCSPSGVRDKADEFVCGPADDMLHVVAHPPPSTPVRP